MKLKDKIAVITGGTRGLGLSTAEALAKEGTRVVVSSRSQDSVDKAVEMLTSRGYEASGITADVGDLLQVQGLARHAVARFGGLDIWVNNAGVVAPYGPSIDIAPQDFYRVVQTNIIGVYHGSRTALHYFNNQNSGKLINILGLGDSGQHRGRIPMPPAKPGCAVTPRRWQPRIRAAASQLLPLTPV